MTITKIARRQLDRGPGEWFEPQAEEPAANQVRVKGGFPYTPGCNVFDQIADQLTAGFAVVTAGFQRYDLVYLDGTGNVQTLAGDEVALGSPAFNGAPGFAGSTQDLPDPCLPVAYVFVDEVAGVVIDQQDITQITGHLPIKRDNWGFYVDKGLLGAAPTGADDVVTALFAGEAPQPSGNARGIVVLPPENFVQILDQNGDELVHNVSGSQVYGRITEAASVWTLAYYHTPGGVETALTTIETECTVVPTDLQLVGVPKVFCQNESGRPLFASPINRVSDQVAGQIPDATTLVKGKVQISVNETTTAAPSVPAADDNRLGRVKVLNAGVAVGTGGFRRFIDFLGGGFGLAENVGADSYEVTPPSVAGVPLGGILPYWPPVSGTPPAAPVGFEYCDGTTVTTVGSPILGLVKPTMMRTPGAPAVQQRTARGADYSVGAHGGANPFGTGGADFAGSHSHNTNSHNHGGGGSSPFSGNTGNVNLQHAHGVTGIQRPNLPPGQTGRGPGELLYTFSDKAFSHDSAGNQLGNHSHPFSGNVSLSLNSDSVNTNNPGAFHDNRAPFVNLAWIVRVI